MSPANFSLSAMKENESGLHIEIRSQRLEELIKTHYLTVCYLQKAIYIQRKTWIEIKGLKKVYTMQKSHIKIRQNRTCDWSYLKQWKTVKKVNPFGKKVTIIDIHTLNSRTTKYTKQNWYNWNDKWIIQK